MSRLLNSIPYILAAGAVALGIFQLAKEWEEYDKHRYPWLRRVVLILLIVIGALTFVSLYLDNKVKAEEKERAEGDIRQLKGEVQSANSAQKDNTTLFLHSFSAMSKEVGDLRTAVRTEALQKKLMSVQAELLNTQKALAPGPKADLTFTFVPYNEAPPGQSTSPATEITVPTQQDGSVHIVWTVLNLTTVDAANVELNFGICTGCKYAKEPGAPLSKLTGMREQVRYLFLAHQQAIMAYQDIAVDIIPPPFARDFIVGFTYRCTTCVLQKAPSQGTVHVSRP